jgi:hypothetical protein
LPRFYERSQFRMLSAMLGGVSGLAFFFLVYYLNPGIGMSSRVETAIFFTGVGAFIGWWTVLPAVVGDIGLIFIYGPGSRILPSAYQGFYAGPIALYVVAAAVCFLAYSSERTSQQDVRMKGLQVPMAGSGGKANASPPSDSTSSSSVALLAEPQQDSK